MSAFKEHFDTGCKLSMIFGALSSLCIFYDHGWIIADAIWYDGWKIVVISIICIVASLFPDIDIKSKSQRIVYAILLAVNAAMLVSGKYVECAILGIATQVPMLTRHRGIFHSYWMAAMLPTIVLWLALREIGPLFLLCWAATWTGYTMHLVDDNRPKSQRHWQDNGAPNIFTQTKQRGV
ncbi:metal-dependent hydrolase [Candidatus Poribacteria bacterium]